MAIFGGRKKNEDKGARTGETRASGKAAKPSAPPAERAASKARSPLEDTVELKRSASSIGTNEARKSEGGAKPTTKGVVVAIIGKSIIFKGELTGDEDLEIDGNVEGDIKLPNHVLTVGSHGKVKAEITAKCVQVIGHVSGNVNATERVEVEATGVVEGDISAPRLLVQEGAIVNGAIKMTKGEGSAAKTTPGQAQAQASTPTPAGNANQRAGAQAR